MADSLILELIVPAEVQAGAPVPITVRVVNTAARDITVSVMGRTIAFDLVVRRADGGVVWRRLEGKSVPAILRLVPLGPGDSLELRDAWEQRGNDGRPVPPGAYTVEGIIPTDAPNPLRTPPIPLAIHQ